MKLRCSVISLAALALLGLSAGSSTTPSSPSDTLVAEYCGENIDGQSFSATAYSSSTSRYYSVDVEFDGDEAIISFSNGGHLRVSLDDEEIDDPNSISAYDYTRAVFWDLDVDGLDCDE